MTSKTEPRSAGSGGGREKTTPTELLALADSFDEVPLTHEDCYDFVKSNRREITTALRALAAREDGWKLPQPMVRPVRGYRGDTPDVDRAWDDGWNACLDEIVNLPAPKAPTAGEGQS